MALNFSTYSSDQIEEIRGVFSKTFSDSEGAEEGLLIGSLAYDLLTQTSSQDCYCFVAIENEEIIGSIIFSKLLFDDDIKTNAFLLSPVAISTDHQGKGVGQKLITFGLNFLKENGAELALTYGDINFYKKVGFELITEKTIKAPLTLTYPEGWLGQSLIGELIEPIAGNSYCVEALNKPNLW